MHTLRNRIILFGGTLAAGLLSLRLHQYMMETCFDDKGLLVAGNLPQKLLWVVAIGFVAMLAVMLHSIGGDGTYDDNFPPCVLSGGMMIAAGALLVWAIPGLELTAQTPVAEGMALALADVTGLSAKYLPWAAAAAMAVVGVYRILGKRPWPIFSGIVCLFYMLMLVTNYRLWSADPQLHDYAYHLLAGVLLMLCSFHRTCCDARVIQRRKLLATGLGAAACCLASLSGDFQWGFYLASGLWAAGSMCHVAVLPPDPEEDEEDSPETPEATEETE